MTYFNTTTASQHIAAFSLAAAVTLGLMTGVNALADGYQAQSYQADSQPIQQVIVIGHRSDLLPAEQVQQVVVIGRRAAQS